MARNYAVFIISHGRSDNVKTFGTLRKHGYTGKIYIVIDSEDDQGNDYIHRYGRENVFVFDKKAIEAEIDTADINGNMHCAVFARHYCFRLAKELNLEYFIEADDDYIRFAYRQEQDGALKEYSCYRLDEVFEAMFQFLDDTGALSVAPAQDGDYLGGAKRPFWINRVSRKCMNLFFCRTDRPINFVGRINEDATTYSRYAQGGELFFTVADWCLKQMPTQMQKGGMTEAYLDMGTYVKSFYTLMQSPSCVTIFVMGSHNDEDGNYRLHHRINWRKCTPMIISGKYKKMEQ